MISETAPEGAKVLDLSALRLARAEARTDQPLPVIKLSTGFVTCVAEVPIEAGYLLGEGKVLETLQLLCADPADADAIIADGLTAQDLSELLTFLRTSLGESSASSQSSRSTGIDSRPTSPAATASA